MKHYTCDSCGKKILEHKAKVNITRKAFSTVSRIDHYKFHLCSKCTSTVILMCRGKIDWKPKEH